MPYKDKKIGREKARIYAEKYRNGFGREKYLKIQRKYSSKRMMGKTCQAPGCSEKSIRGSWTHCKKHNLIKWNLKIYNRVRTLMSRQTGLNFGDIDYEFKAVLFFLHEQMEVVRGYRNNSNRNLEYRS